MQFLIVCTLNILAGRATLQPFESCLYLFI
uniref:Uncharacterized protein n=1 Tax=Anguilla anguilla TaxID=7936 RepID=A0A0E9S3G9_ANGAN